MLVLPCAGIAHVNKPTCLNNSLLPSRVSGAIFAPETWAKTRYWDHTQHRSYTLSDLPKKPLHGHDNIGMLYTVGKLSILLKREEHLPPDVRISRQF